MNMTSRGEPAASGERLQKLLARTGVGSRRSCEKLIAEGRVKINGETVKEFGVRVFPDRDIVAVDGVTVQPEKPLHLVFHKPRNCLCTSADDRGRKTVFDFLPGISQRIYTVGRLDYDAEGLLILTNDGDFAQRVIHPRQGIRKTYQVTVGGYFTTEAGQGLLQGVHLDGKLIRAASVEVLSRDKRCSRLEIVVYQGLNRQVKRMLKRVGYEVSALKRTVIGGVHLGSLRPGKFRRMMPGEIHSFDDPGKDKQ
jgi:23S rRNA pseudouridine2605 synthase